jgi:hypothetical protein
VFDLYRHEIELANAIIAAATLGSTPGPVAPGALSRPAVRNLRKTMLAVINETACHAGHLDAARKVIAGRSWLVVAA